MMTDIKTVGGKMQLLDKQIAVMRQHLLNAINNIESRCVFSAFQDIMKFMTAFLRYVKILEQIRNGNLKK